MYFDWFGAVCCCLGCDSISDVLVCVWLLILFVVTVLFGLRLLVVFGLCLLVFAGDFVILGLLMFWWLIVLSLGLVCCTCCYF